MKFREAHWLKMLIKKDPYCVNMRMPILTEVEKIKKKEENSK